MALIAAKPWRIQDELIEQPSWGGRYIIDLKGLGSDDRWAGKKVGQSYELARSSKLFDPETGALRSLTDLLAAAPLDLLGAKVVDKFGSDLSLLIKLTQAKGNSFQVHLPEGKALNHWIPKPEAWFYLAPGLFTFGMKKGVSYEDFSAALREIDALMTTLSGDVKSGRLPLESARATAAAKIAQLNPYQYINVIEANTDDIVDLTDGAIHHSWEENDAKFPDGNLVYEVQVDVQDAYCSMRGFDKGKLLDDGSLRPTHVEDYLATIINDDRHNDLAQHIQKPRLVSDDGGVRTEALFRTPYFNLDRISMPGDSESTQSVSNGFHHLFVQDGSARIDDTDIEQGQSFLIPANAGEYGIISENGVTILKTYLPV
ncbi:MAG TPA: hypothetical protein VGK19_04045 [Capsulimonadaceae bacterium]